MCGQRVVSAVNAVGQFQTAVIGIVEIRIGVGKRCIGLVKRNVGICILVVS